MDNADIDHYLVLGLPSGEQGFRLTEKDITTAYRSKALELHPDKRPDDPDAPANFLKLQTSYQILKDGKGRKLFDDLLRAKKQKRQREMQHDSKRRRMRSDLDQRERASIYAFHTTAKARSEVEIITRKITEEADSIRKEHVDRIRKMHANNSAFPTAREPVKSEGPLVNEELADARFMAFQDSVLQKLRNAAETQRVDDMKEKSQGVLTNNLGS